MALTDAAIRKAKPAAKPVKMADERGLYLLLTPAGGKLWRFKYRFHGKEKLLAFGAYPEISLSSARERREDARKLLGAGTDPAEQRRLQREAAGATFELVARDWFETFSPKWSPSHRVTIISRLERNVFPFIGSRAIREIAAPELLSALRRIEARGANETAHRVRQICSQVFCYAIATGRAERDPSADIKGALAPVETTHHAAITDPNEAAGLLRVLDQYEGTIIVRCALRLAPLVFVRPGELRKAEWSEFNLDEARWIIPPWRMKMKQALIVPLSRQAVAILRDLHPVTGEGRFVFPSARSAQRPMSNNAILAALRRSGIGKDEMSGHGFRALARTILDEVLNARVELIEHQLGHAVKDPNGRAYNRTSYLGERTAMMQRWSDYLDSLKAAPRHAERIVTDLQSSLTSNEAGQR